MAVVVSEQALAQGCRPTSERVGDQIGCWILTDEGLGQLPQKPMFWHLVNYPTRSATALRRESDDGRFGRF
jgi:hypothetical protein